MVLFYQISPQTAPGHAPAHNMLIALISTGNKRSDLVCFLITYPLNSRHPVGCLDGAIWCNIDG